MGKITVTLGSTNMGTDCDEADFDAWASWVCEHIDEAMQFYVYEVNQHPFGSSDGDRVVGATEEQKQAILTWLSVDGWEAFCATPGAWPKRVEAGRVDPVVGL